MKAIMKLLTTFQIGDKVLIFSNFTKSLSLLKATLTENHYKEENIAVLIGSLNTKDRQEQIQNLRMIQDVLYF